MERTLIWLLYLNSSTIVLKNLQLLYSLTIINFLLIVTDLITAVVRLLQRDINGLVKTALGELELVKL